jgi:hypothetical protein
MTFVCRHLQLFSNGQSDWLKGGCEAIWRSLGIGACGPSNDVADAERSRLAPGGINVSTSHGTLRNTDRTAFSGDEIRSECNTARTIIAVLPSDSGQA